jgi:replicative DNA helicase
MGKTAFALAIAQKAAEKNHVLYFSLEMTNEKLADRMIIGQSGVNADRYYEGSLNESEISEIENARLQLRQLKIKAFDHSSLTVEQIRAICRTHQKKNACDLIIIDYLGLIKPTAGNKNYNRTNEVGDVSRKLKALAKDINVPVIALSQLSRESEKREGRKPRLSDLRDSGDIEQDADVAILMFRYARYPDICLPEDANKGELYVEKNRNGRTGTVAFTHNENLTRFYNVKNIKSNQVFQKEMNF